jgi:hypothetical protein
MKKMLILTASRNQIDKTSQTRAQGGSNMRKMLLLAARFTLNPRQDKSKTRTEGDGNDGKKGTSGGEHESAWPWPPDKTKAKRPDNTATRALSRLANAGCKGSTHHDKRDVIESTADVLLLPGLKFLRLGCEQILQPTQFLPKHNDGVNCQAAFGQSVEMMEERKKRHECFRP